MEALRHPDGTPVYRVEETRPLLGSSRAPRMEAERPKQRRWNGVDDPISHCLAGNSLLLTGLSGHRKDAPGPDDCGEAARAGRGGAPGVQDALLRAEPGSGSTDGRPLGAQVRARGQRAKAGLAGGGGLWADLACVEHSQLIRDLAGGHRHELTENMRSDPGIFNFVKWLRVGEEACPTLEQAKARLKELYPSKPGWPDTTLVISHSKRMAVNAAANRALAPEASKLLQLAAPHGGRRKDTQGRLCGRGGSGAGRSEAGQRHAAEEPGAAPGHPAEPRSDLRQV